MPNIFPLPESLISKIAAGEVIERPMYAVKELLDNALDAGADEIKITVENSGLKKITIIDNGSGMSGEDLQTAWRLHTTSKLHTEEDLYAIPTLGFRGEALASIAAISKLSIKSKTDKDTIGANIEIANGKVLNFSPIGLPKGTEVTISNLFANVPARKKFLKSERTEFRHILNLVSSYAIAYPGIRFSFAHNDRVLFDVAKNSDQIERILLLFGASLKQVVVPLSARNEYISLHGLISKPQTHLLLSQRQHIFINNRLVYDKVILSAIRDAYADIHARNFQPVVFLFLKIPYEMVDVNVHPRKEEIRFHNTDMIYDLVFQIVKKTLQNKNDSSKNWFAQTDVTGLSLGDGSSRPGLTDSFAASLLRENILQSNLDISGHLQQMHRLYILKETITGLEVVDQHAAHERILYEKLLSEFRSRRKKQPTYHLPKPQLFEVSLADSELLQEYLPVFTQLGFHIERFKNTAFLLQSLPLLFKDRNAARLLSELLTDLHQGKKVKDIDTISKRMIAYLACRAAVKAGDILTETQMHDLLKQLAQTENNTTCPHGRPTKVEIELNKIHRLFKRR